MSKDTKKFLSFVLVLCLIFTQFAAPGLFANDSDITFISTETPDYVLATEADYNALGVKSAGSTAKYPADYVSDDGKVNNFRTASKAVGGVTYQWLIPQWTNHKVSSLYLGDAGFDMSRVEKITIDYLSNKDTATTKVNTISLSKDKDGAEKVATIDVTSFPAGSMTEKYTVELNVVDATYNGPVYLYLDTDVRMFIGNLQVTLKAVTEAPATEVPATEAPATEAPATEAPAANLKDKLGGYFFYTDLFDAGKFSVGTTIKGGSTGKTEDGKYFNFDPVDSKKESYATISGLDSYETTANLAIKDYPIIVAKFKQSVAAHQNDSGTYCQGKLLITTTEMGDSTEAKNKVSLALTDPSSTEWELVIYDISKDSAFDSVGGNLTKIKQYFSNQTCPAEYYVTFEYVAFFAADTDLSSFDGDLAALLAGGETPVDPTEAPATEAPATEAPATEAPATEAPATEAPATEAPATEAPATEAPADPTAAPSTDLWALKQGLGGYIYTKDMIVGTHFSVGNSLVRAQSGGGSGNVIYLTPKTGRGSDSYATITLQDADAVKGLNVNTYSKLVVKIQLSREFVDGESKAFAVSINGGEARSAELVSTTAGQFLVIDLAGAGADSLETIKPSFGAGMTDYQKYTIEYFAFFSADANLSGFDGDLDAVINAEAPQEPDPEPVPGDSIDNPEYMMDVQHATTVKGSATKYIAGMIHGMNVKITGAGSFTVEFDGTTYESFDGEVTFTVPNSQMMGRPMPAVFSITNATAEDVEYTIKAEYPLGHRENPDVFDEQFGGFAYIEAGNNQGYFLKFVASTTGTFTFDISNYGESQIDVSVQNLNTFAMKTLLEDGVDGKLSIDVTAGDEIMIIVSSIPDASYNYPEAQVGLAKYVKPGTDAEHPIEFVYDYDSGKILPIVSIIGANDNVFFGGRIDGTIVTIKSNGSFTVEYNGQQLVSENGVVTFDAVSPGFMMPVVFAVTNNDTSDVEFTITAEYPVGDSSNPDSFNPDDKNTADLKANDNDGYFYEYIVTENGTLVFEIISITEGVEGDIVVEFTRGDTTIYKTLAEDGVDGKLSVEVQAGDVLSIRAVVLPDSNWNISAATIEFGLYSEPVPGESEDCRLDIYDMESTVTVAPGQTIYLQSYRLGNTIVTISGAGAFAVDHNGVAIVPADGAATFAAQGNMFNPDLIAITNNSAETVTYTIKAEYPVGHASNPDSCNAEDKNTANLAEGDYDGYFFEYTATEDGTLVFEITNITEGVEGDIIVNFARGEATINKTLGADGVDGKLSVEVKAGDVLSISVVALPDSNWNIPAASIEFGLYTAPAVDPDTGDVGLIALAFVALSTVILKKKEN